MNKREYPAKKGNKKLEELYEEIAFENIEIGSEETNSTPENNELLEEINKEIKEIDTIETEGLKKAMVLGGEEGEKNLKEELEPGRTEKADITEKIRKQQEEAKLIEEIKKAKIHMKEVSRGIDKKKDNNKSAEQNTSTISEDVKTEEEIQENQNNETLENTENTKDSNTTEPAPITRKEKAEQNKINKRNKKPVKAELVSDAKSEENESQDDTLKPLDFLSEENLENKKDESEEFLKPLNLEDKQTSNLEQNNEKVLARIEQNQEKKKEGWLSRTKEGAKNALTKSADWWNKDYSERTKREKIAKSMMSAGFIGTSMFLSAWGLDSSSFNTHLLPKDTGFLGKVGSRTFMAGLASSVLASEQAQRAISGVKEKFANMSKVQKIATLGALGVGGIGGFVYFAGIGALATTALAISARQYADAKYNKGIEKRNTELKSKEEKIVEIKKQIEDEENSPAKNLDISALSENLGQITKDIEKLNSELRKVKTYQSLARGAISFAGGLGTMAVVNAGKVNWRELLENTKTKVEEFLPTKETASTPVDIQKTAEGNSIKELGNAMTQDSSTLENSNEVLGNDSTKTENILVVPPGEINNPMAIDSTRVEIVEELKSIPKNNLEEIKINPNAIIDGKERVGITYAFRDQLKADKKLTEDLCLDYNKLDDAKYVAKITKDLAIKLGYMDGEGHEIRISEDGTNKVAYVLSANADGKAEVNEVNVETGKTIQTHCEGDNFEGKNFNKEYEYYTDEAYDYNKDIKVDTVLDNKPEYPGEVTDASINPDSVLSNEVKAIGEVTDAKLENTSIEKYDFQTVEKSPEWQKVENMKLKQFFAIGKSNMNSEQIKVAEYLRAEYAQALAKDSDLEKFILSKQDTITVDGARQVYNDVINKNYDIKEVEYKNNTNTYGSIEDELKTDQELKELTNIARENKYKLSEEELKSTKKVYQENINKIFGDKKQGWYEGKDQSVSKYMKLGDETPLSKHLNQINKLGNNFEPKNGFLGIKKEQIDHYLMRVTLEAQKTGRLDLIKPQLDKVDEVYQGIEGGETQIKINSTNDPKDDLYN